MQLKKLKKKFTSCLAAAAITTASVFAANAPINVKAADDAYEISADTYYFTMQGTVADSAANNLIYHADVPNVDNFIDAKGYLNMAYVYDGKVYVKRMDSHYNEIDELALSLPMERFGAITCDKDGNYYVVSAVSSLPDEAYTDEVMTITKYDYDGRKVIEKSYLTNETCPFGWYSGDDINKWLTQVPFDAGSCDLAVSDNGVLACNYARKMFSGHQSNFIFYVDTDTLEMKDKGSVPYASHSFDQRIIALSNNTFLDLEQGDSYNRGFMLIVSGEETGQYQKISDGDYTPFHFREGANRASGYNETFAQMGSLIEIDGGAAYCATSEKTLSLTAAPSTIYYGHNEARDVFVQIFNIKNNTLSTVGGETRTPVDKVTGDEATALKLTGDEVDTGVIWLTDYEDEYWAANSRIVNVGDYLVVLWEKLAYTSDFYGRSEESDGIYYAVLDLQGNILKQPEKFGEMELPANYDVVTDGKNIFFATTDGTDKMTLNVVTLNFDALKDVLGVAGHQIFVTEALAPTCGSDGYSEGKYCRECGEYIEEPKKFEKTGTHTWNDGEITSEPTCEKKGERTYTCEICGETKTEEIEKLDHTAVVDEAVEATCSSTGLTEGSHCSVCGEVLVSQMVIEKNDNHAWNAGEIKLDPTCEEKGEGIYTCEICGETKTEEIEAIGHTEVVDEAVEATCSSTGLTEGSHCSVCDKVLVSQILVEKNDNHAWNAREIKSNPTCEKKGECIYTCEICGETKTEEIEAIGHTVVADKAVEATCKSTGLTEGSHCSVCNKVLKEQKTVAKITAHSYRTTITKATTSKDGAITKKCTICGATQTTKIARIKSITISTAKYTYDGKAKKPTVTLKDSSGKKIPAANYTVKYTNNKKVGKASVAVTMKGSSYSGSYKLNFEIVPKGTVISKLTPASKGFKVTLKKQKTQTTGYEIRYRVKGSKKWTVKKLTKTSITVKKLKAKKNYQLQVRTYKKNGKTYYYSAWSKTKTVKTKK